MDDIQKLLRDIGKYIPKMGIFSCICISFVVLLLLSYRKGVPELSSLEDFSEVSEQCGSTEQSSILDSMGISDESDVSAPDCDFEDTPQDDISVEDSFDSKSDNSQAWFSVKDIRGYMFATNSVNVRELPSKDYSKVGLLSSGDSIEVSGICSNGWYQVVYNGTYAYVFGEYLSSEEPSQTNSGYSGFILSDGVDDKWLSKLESNYNKVPQNVRDKFESDGWSIICTSQKLGIMFYSDSSLSVQAVTDQLNRKIWVEGRDAAMSSVIHEIGHYIDISSSSSWLSSEQEFFDIFEEEVESFRSVVNTHANNTKTTFEYFAEAYEVSIEHPDLILKYCPKTYEYVMRCSNAL